MAMSETESALARSPWPRGVGQGAEAGLEEAVALEDARAEEGGEGIGGVFRAADGVEVAVASDLQLARGALVDARRDGANLTEGGEVGGAVLGLFYGIYM